MLTIGDLDDDDKRWLSCSSDDWDEWYDDEEEDDEDEPDDDEFEDD